jgi:hypothetical protein
MPWSIKQHNIDKMKEIIILEIQFRALTGVYFPATIVVGFLFLAHISENQSRTNVQNVTLGYQFIMRFLRIRANI